MTAAVMNGSHSRQSSLGSTIQVQHKLVDTCSTQPVRHVFNTTHVVRVQHNLVACVQHDIRLSQRIHLAFYYTIILCLLDISESLREYIPPLGHNPHPHPRGLQRIDSTVTIDNRVFLFNVR